MTEESRTSRVLADTAALASAAAGAVADRLTVALGGAERTRVIVVLACVLGLSGADAATVGASATELTKERRCQLCRCRSGDFMGQPEVGP